MSPLLAAMAANTGWLLGEKALRLLAALVVGALTVRHLGPSDFGLLSLALALVALFSALASLGLDALVVRDLAQGRPRDEVLGSAAALRAAGALCALALTVAAAALLEPGAPGVLVLACLAAPALFLQPLEPIDLWFRSRLEARSGVIARNAAFAVASAARLALIALDATAPWFAAVSSLEAGIAALALVAMYRRGGLRVSAWRATPAAMATLLAQAWPLALSGLMVSLYMRIDQVMLGQLAGTEALGVYSAAVLLSEPLQMLPLAVAATAAPLLAQWHVDDPPRFRARLEDLVRWLVGGAIALALPVSVLAPWLAPALLGEAFREAAGVLAVHAWSSVFVALGVVGTQLLVLEKLTHVALHRTIAGAALNVGLNLAWIPAYGAVGCAWATLVSYAAASVFLFHTAASRRCLLLLAQALVPPRRRA